VLILDDKDNPVYGRHLENGEVIHLDSIVRFPSHMAVISKCLSSPWGLKEPSPLRWNVLCSSLVMGEWTPNRPAFLILRRSAKRIILLNYEEVLIDAHSLLEDEVIKPRISLELPVHKVIVGSEISNSILSKVSHETPKPSCMPASTTHLSLNFEKGECFKRIS
jgi:hypothetical protein